MTPTRVLPLAGAVNFRDVGGYEARDGARVRWGRLYRSGLLSRLDRAATTHLAGQGLRAVVDLRRTTERNHHPNPDFGPAVRRYEWDTETESSPIRDASFAASADDESAHAAMCQMYQRLPFVLRPRLAGVFEALGAACAEAGAVVVHCTAGKDRTGVAVALVLDALGVARDAIVDDYELTDRTVDLHAQLLRRANGAGLADSASLILALSPVAREAVLAARGDYLRASFDAIEARHGTVGDYLISELGVSQAALERLRQSLLE